MCTITSEDRSLSPSVGPYLKMLKFEQIVTLQRQALPIVLKMNVWVVFLKNGPNPASFGLFSFFSQYNDNYSTNLTVNEIKA